MQVAVHDASAPLTEPPLCTAELEVAEAGEAAEVFEKHLARQLTPPASASAAGRLYYLARHVPIAVTTPTLRFILHTRPTSKPATMYSHVEDCQRNVRSLQ